MRGSLPQRSNYFNRSARERRDSIFHFSFLILNLSSFLVSLKRNLFASSTIHPEQGLGATRALRRSHVWSLIRFPLLGRLRIFFSTVDPPLQRCFTRCPVEEFAKLSFGKLFSLTLIHSLVLHQRNQPLWIACAS